MPCVDCPYQGLEEAFARDFGEAYEHWRRLNSTRPLGFGVGMIPANAAAAYLALLGETQELLEQVLDIESVIYPHLNKPADPKD